MTAVKVFMEKQNILQADGTCETYRLYSYGTEVARVEVYKDMIKYFYYFTTANTHKLLQDIKKSFLSNTILVTTRWKSYLKKEN